MPCNLDQVVTSQFWFWEWSQAADGRCAVARKQMRMSAANALCNLPHLSDNCASVLRAGGSRVAVEKHHSVAHCRPGEAEGRGATCSSKALAHSGRAAFLPLCRTGAWAIAPPGNGLKHSYRNTDRHKFLFSDLDSPAPFGRTPAAPRTSLRRSFIPRHPLPLAAPICSDDFGAASYISPPP